MKRKIEKNNWMTVQIGVQDWPVRLETTYENIVPKLRKTLMRVGTISLVVTTELTSRTRRKRLSNARGEERGGEAGRGEQSRERGVKKRDDEQREGGIEIEKARTNDISL